MKASILSLLSASSVALASHTGGEIMGGLMSRKLETRQRARDQGFFNLNKYPELGATPCKDGKAGEYSCENVDLLGFISHQAMESKTREGNDLWGKSGFFFFPPFLTFFFGWFVRLCF